MNDELGTEDNQQRKALERRKAARGRSFGKGKARKDEGPANCPTPRKTARFGRVVDQWYLLEDITAPKIGTLTQLGR